MDRRKIIISQIAKYTILALSVFVLYILQSTPGFLNILGIKPVLMLPFCITLSMLDDTRYSYIVYVLGGMLTDLSCGRVIGTYTIMLTLVCLLGVIAVKFFFRPSKRNFYLFSFIAMIIMLTIDFSISFTMTGIYTGKIIYYIKNVILVSAYSALFSLMFNVYIDYINLRFLRFDAR